MSLTQLQDRHTLADLNAIGKMLRDGLFDEDVTEDELLELANQLAEVDGAIEDKAVGYAQVISRAESEAAYIKAEEERLADRRKTIEKRKEKLEQRFATLMLDYGRDRIETTLTTIKIREKSKVVAKVTAANLPEEFISIGKPSRTANLTALREALERGEATEYAEFRHGVTWR
jgi:hypothetical protein